MADSSGGLFGLDPSLLANLGMGLLSMHGATAGQTVGGALQGAMQNYYGQKQAQQGLQLGNVDLQTKQLGLERTKQMLHIVGGLMGDPVDPSQSAAQGAPAAPPSPGMPQMPPQGMGAPPQGPPGQQPMPPQGQQPPQWLTPPTQQQVGQTQIGGMDPRLLNAYNIWGGKDPLQSSKELEAAQLEQQQRKYAPIIGKLDTLIKSDSPTREVAADPDLRVHGDHWLHSMDMIRRRI